MSRPYAPACERNKDPILAHLKTIFSAPGTVLEIGSGTGQHAAYFAQQLPHINWQPSDQQVNLEAIEQWRQTVNLPNLRPALTLDVTCQPWPIEQHPVQQIDGVFSANTAHIMSWPMVQDFIAGVGRVLCGQPQAYFCLYGPFNYKGQYTSASNAHFDASLQAQNAAMGIRDFEAIDALAQQAGMLLDADHAMPANNRLLVWRCVD